MRRPSLVGYNIELTVSLVPEANLEGLEQINIDAMGYLSHHWIQPIVNLIEFQYTNLECRLFKFTKPTKASRPK
jgi:hypothetical protein